MKQVLFVTENKSRLVERYNDKGFFLDELAATLAKMLMISKRERPDFDEVNIELSKLNLLLEAMPIVFMEGGFYAFFEEVIFDLDRRGFNLNDKTLFYRLREMLVWNINLENGQRIYLELFADLCEQYKEDAFDGIYTARAFYHQTGRRVDLEKIGASGAGNMEGLNKQLIRLLFKMKFEKLTVESTEEGRIRNLEVNAVRREARARFFVQWLVMRFGTKMMDLFGKAVGLDEFERDLARRNPL